MKQFLVMATAIVSLWACSAQNEQSPEKMSKDEIIAVVNDLHDSLVNPTSLELSAEHASNLMTYCTAFADKFPSDSLAPEMLYKASRSARGLKDFTRSIAIYNQIISDYPEYEKLPECYFFKAFIYDNDLKDKPKAEVAYQEVMAQFPEHRFSQDAKLLIEHLYLTDEELIKLFEEKNKEADPS
ncbi:MAG: tetratricopeptide (TPR) repeat protein [Flavobacteriales bacterium]|jgi:tetratricopeptide (TPR) repeat protein